MSSPRNASAPLFSPLGRRQSEIRFSLTVLLSFFIATEPAWAGLTQISNSPLASSTSAQVKPNIMFILDTSGSMAWDFMPDSISNRTGTVGYKNSSCNYMYYNPNVTYTVPKKSDGSNFPTASFTGAYSNGYSNYPTGPTSGATDLSTSFSAYSGNSSQGAYYYTYTGTQTLTPNSSACNTTDSNSSSQTANITSSGTGGGTWAKRRVTSTSGPGATDERTNFANWYQYYRTRVMMAKGTASRAFNQLTDSYRAGFITIAPMNYSWSTGYTVDSDQYVPIGDFDTAKRTSWFTTLFSQSTHDSTPLREALARVGRHYAGKTDGINNGMSQDPVQYSCQQNFAILTSDGYWNTDSEIEGPVQVNGTSNVGQQDGDISVTPRPLWDGAATISTVTYKSNTYNSNVTCNSARQRRDQQIQKRTLQYQTRTQQIQQRSVQLQQRTEQYQKTTVTTTSAARANIIITSVNSSNSLNQIRISPSNNSSGNRLSSPVSGSGGTGSARLASLRDNLANATFTDGYAVSGSGNCTGNNNPVSGCSNGAVYVTIMAPASAGNITLSMGETDSGISASTTNFSGGVNPSVNSTVDVAALCSASTSIAGNSRTDVSCSTTDTGFQNAGSCADTGGAFNGSGTRISCQSTDTGFQNASSCAANGGPVAGLTVTCQTTDTGFANSGRCTASSSGGQTVTCQTTSDTGWVDASSCSASSNNTQPTIDCQTTDSGYYNVASCSSGTSNGLTVSCRTNQAGKMIQYSTTTSTVSTNLNTGATSTSGPTTGSAQNYDGVCYAGGNGMPTPPANGTPAPTESPTPPSGCSGWPCTTTSTSGGSSNSLADVAQYYYANDLRTSMDNNVPTSGTGTEDDKATWQHMTTFTLGLGLAGSLSYRSDYKTAGTGDFQDIRDGIKNWPVPSADDPTALDDLWHAAVNGRGQFFSASDPDAVVDGLTTALSGVNARVASAAAAATSNLEPVAGDNFAYTAKYKTVEWIGELEAHEIDLTTGEVMSTVTWSAQSQLDAQTKNSCDNRTIYLFRSGSTSPAKNLADFSWNTQACDSSGNPTGAAATGLNASEQAYFGSTQLQALSQYTTMTDGSGTPATTNQRSLAVGDKLVNFVRGQRGYEGYETNSATKFYRTRTHVLGDIVNAQPVYVKAPFASYSDTGYTAFKTSGTAATRSPMVYVAANDGMLHAFYAGSSSTDPLGGKERWAFIPSMVVPKLYKLADDNYANTHAYSVDGTPTVGDFYDTSASAWKTMLVAGLRAGGKGYYALDITDPASPKGLWEFKQSDTCYDASDSTTWYADCHLGYSYNNPMVTKLADGTWVVIVSSGYNNVNSPVKTGDGLGYLYVLRAYDGKILYKIATTAGNSATPSGLNYINGMTDNGIVNNTTLRVYGVDLLGNTWRFDINDSIDPSGREAALIGTAKTSGGNAQPISTKPEVTLKGSDVFIMVGTGKMLGSDDLTDTLQQSVYGFVDPLSAGPVYTNLRGSLKPLALATVGSGSTATRTVSCTGNTAQCNVAAGWVIDLADSGERVSVDMRLQLGTLVFGTNVPESSACTIGGYSWLNFVNYSTGTAVASSSGSAVSQKLSSSLVVGLNIVRLPDGRTVVITTTSDAKQTTIGAPFDTPSPTGKRISWREIPQQ